MTPYVSMPPDPHLADPRAGERRYTRLGDCQPDAQAPPTRQLVPWEDNLSTYS